MSLSLFLSVSVYLSHILTSFLTPCHCLSSFLFLFILLTFSLPFLLHVTVSLPFCFCLSFSHSLFLSVSGYPSHILSSFLSTYLSTSLFRSVSVYTSHTISLSVSKYIPRPLSLFLLLFIRSPSPADTTSSSRPLFSTRRNTQRKSWTRSSTDWPPTTQRST